MSDLQDAYGAGFDGSSSVPTHVDHTDNFVRDEFERGRRERERSEAADRAFVNSLPSFWSTPTSPNGVFTGPDGPGAGLVGGALLLLLLLLAIASGNLIAIVLVLALSKPISYIGKALGKIVVWVVRVSIKSLYWIIKNTFKSIFKGAFWKISGIILATIFCLFVLLMIIGFFLSNKEQATPVSGSLQSGIVSRDTVASGPTHQGIAEKPGTSLSSATPATRDISFDKGLEDRKLWDQWFNNLRDSCKDGAAFWASQRSKRNRSSCATAKGSADRYFKRCCMEARGKLDPIDKLRKSDKNYRNGWNSK